MVTTPLLLALTVCASASEAPTRREHLPTRAYVEPKLAAFKPGKLGAVTKVSAAADGAVELACGSDLLRVAFHSNTAVRIWLAAQDSSGAATNFTDPAGGEGAPGHKKCVANPGCVSKAIAIGTPTVTKTSFEDKGAYYLLSAGQPSADSITLRATKSPALIFSMYSGSTSH